MTRLAASARGIGASPSLSGAELGSVPDRRAADLPRAAPAARRFALVLSGGGARGAYEAGVLRYLLDRLPDRLGRPVRFQIITGTSVGAVHACYLAATLGRAAVGRHLAEIWLSLDLARTYQVGVRDLVTLPRRLLGLGRRGAAALDGGWERLRGLLETLPLDAKGFAGGRESRPRPAASWGWYCRSASTSWVSMNTGTADADGIGLASRAFFLIMWRRTGAEVADRRRSECGILP